MSQVKQTTQNAFQSDVLDAERPVLVDFYADWCAPCRAQSPLLDTLAKNQEGQLDIVKVNIDDSPELAQAYGVRSIPTLVLFKDGEALTSRTGLQSQPQLEQLVAG